MVNPMRIRRQRVPMTIADCLAEVWRAPVRRPFEAALRLSALAVALVVAAAPDDAVAAMNEFGVTPFPQSERVQVRRGTEPDAHEFVLGSVERVRGQVRVGDSVRLRGVVSTATYEAPRGSALSDVIAHYREQLIADGATALFECRGRDCGRSTLWANQIFGQAILYGPDRDQFYLSVKRDSGDHGELLAAYVVERGNNRVYAHVEHVMLSEPLVLDLTAVLVEGLQRQGFAKVAEVPYDMRGALPQSVRDQLERFTEPLAALQPGQLHLVCHLYGVAPVPDLMERSTECAQQARAVIDPEGHLNIEAVGFGPLAPHNGRAESRIELILPTRLTRP
jgi:hypothetical protein